jgi:hypothetical protein
VRLDALSKHRGHGSFTYARYGRGEYAGIAVFRALWTVLAAGGAAGSENHAELFALPVSKVRLEEQRKAAAEAGRATGGFTSFDREAQPARHSAAEALAQHAFLQQLAEFIQTAGER